MPKDIAIGEGYVGLALAERFPNQYRDADKGADAVSPPEWPEAPEPAYAQVPGRLMGRPFATDPPPMQIRDVPGIGVVAMRGMSGPVSPVSHEMAGMGGIAAAIAEAVGGEELDELARNMNRLQDQIVASYGRLDELEEQEKEASGLAAMASVSVGPFGVPIPSARSVETLKAAEATREGYSSLTALAFMLEVFSNAFEQSRYALEEAGFPISAHITTWRNWRITWNERVAPKEGQRALMTRLQGAHLDRWYAQIGGPFEPDDPRYVATAQDALAEATGLSPENLRAAGMADLGIAPAILGLIYAVVVAIGVITVVVGAIALAREFNAKARMLHETHENYEARMASEQKDFLARCAGEGRTSEDCLKAWSDYRTGEDAKQEEKEKGIAEKMPGFDLGKTLLTVALPVAAVIAGAILVGRAFK